jgi:hypothetical protein
MMYFDAMKNEKNLRQLLLLARVLFLIRVERGVAAGRGPFVKNARPYTTTVLLLISHRVTVSGC